MRAERRVNAIVCVHHRGSDAQPLDVEAVHHDMPLFAWFVTADGLVNYVLER